MPIILDRFLATHVGPKRADKGVLMRWEWWRRVHGEDQPRTILIYDRKDRAFRAELFGVGKGGLFYKKLSKRDAEKLRSMLPATELAGAVSFTITGEFPDDTCP